MSGDLRETLAAALGIEAKPIGRVQRAYNDHKKYLSGKALTTPLPEVVHLLDDNFPYWIKLENPDPSRPGETIGAKSNLVIPLLENGDFDDSSYTFDETRVGSLLNIPALLRNPNCIHRNLRHAERGHGGIKGLHVYVEYLRRNVRRVAFTAPCPRSGLTILVSSFYTKAAWIGDCAGNPAIYVKTGSRCSCCI